MWKPDQSLEDYTLRPTPEAASEPPRSVSLQRTGEVEVVKPLIALEVRRKPAWTAFMAFRPSGPLQPLWFRRFLAVGSGALVMIALVLVSAILVGINDPAGGPDFAANWKPDDKLAQPGEPFSFDPSTPWNFALATGGVDIIRSNPRRRPARPSIHLAANKPEPQSRRPAQPDQPKFVPTTLVIYAENGVIYSRIEPWFQEGEKKTSTYNN